MKKFILLLIGLGVLGVGAWIGLDIYQFNLKKAKEDALRVGKLTRQLRDEKPLRRGRAALALGKMGSRSAKAVPALIGILGDEAKLERTLNRRRTSWKTSPGREAALALAKIGKPAMSAP